MTDKPRTPKQNNSLWLYAQLLGDELNDNGWDMRKTLKSSIDIPWTKKSIVDFIWRPVQETMFGTDSTRKLTTKELQQVWEVVSRHLGEKCGVHVGFPTEESTESYYQSLEKMK